MNKFRLITSCLITIYFSHADLLFALSGIKRVKEIEFKGLRFLSKNEIVEKIDIKRDGNSLIIDVKSLEKRLKNLPVIKNFSVSDAGERLVITLIENDPQFLLAFGNGNNLVPFEMDAKFRVISVNRVHLNNKPLIVISRNEIRNGKITNRLRSFLNLLKELSDASLSVYNEIAEIDITDFSRAEILLKGRRTRFILKPVKDFFFKLNHFVGYLDRIGYYPEYLQVIGNSGVISSR